jgi:hypothetical protein
MPRPARRGGEVAIIYARRYWWQAWCWPRRRCRCRRRCSARTSRTRSRDGLAASTGRPHAARRSARSHRRSQRCPDHSRRGSASATSRCARMELDSARALFARVLAANRSHVDARRHGPRRVAAGRVRRRRARRSSACCVLDPQRDDVRQHLASAARAARAAAGGRRSCCRTRLVHRPRARRPLRGAHGRRLGAVLHQRREPRRGAARPVPERVPGRGTYRQWIADIAAMGANTVRVYTMHPPAFYDALAAHNAAHPERPLWLLHGVWAELPPTTTTTTASGRASSSARWSASSTCCTAAPT